jgi:hypothetical protein
VADSEVFFSLEFSSQGAPAALLDTLSSQLLTHVGVRAADLPELSAALQRAVAEGSLMSAAPASGATGRTTDAQRRCDVQFRVRGSTLEIVVTANGGRVWQTSRRLP